MKHLPPCASIASRRLSFFTKSSTDERLQDTYNDALHLTLFVSVFFHIFSFQDTHVNKEKWAEKRNLRCNESTVSTTERDKWEEHESDWGEEGGEAPYLPSVPITNVSNEKFRLIHTSKQNRSFNVMALEESVDARIASAM